MNFLPGELYHISNQGNNNQLIFFHESNYNYFLKKLKKYIVPFCDLLSFCLIPSEFHLMVHANKWSKMNVRCGAVKMSKLSNGIRILESSYAKGINKQENRSGSLFRQNSKSHKLTLDPEFFDSSIHALGCFNFIHELPINLGLVPRIEEWAFSSIREYTGMSSENLCNKDLAFHFLNLESETPSLKSFCTG